MATAARYSLLYRNPRFQFSVYFRVEPPVTRGAPPQTRTSAINASGSSGHAFAKSPDITVYAFAICGQCERPVRETVGFAVMNRTETNSCHHAYESDG